MLSLAKYSESIVAQLKPPRPRRYGTLTRIVGLTLEAKGVSAAVGSICRILRPDGEHVDAWGIRNEQYGPGTFAYNIPHPGVVLLSPEGEILAKWAEAGYRSRADWKAVFNEVRAIVRGQ